MTELTNQEIDKIVYRYIGVSSGYLGDFSYSSHARFYPSYCDLDIDPYQYQGTTRQKFTEILKNQPAKDQAKILRGVLERFPLDESITTRTQALQDEIRKIITRLEQNLPVVNPSPQITSKTIAQAIVDAENLLVTSGAASAVDRVHTALHAYLKEVYDLAGITYIKEDSITRLLKLIRQNHPAFQTAILRNQDIEKVLNAFGATLDSLNSIRNNASLAHPNLALLEEPEAMLAINAARTIFHYLDAKIK